MSANFYRPETLCQLLQQRSEHREAVVLAGGTDLLVYLREGKLSPAAILDLGGVAELSAMRIKDEQIVLGATVTYTRAAESQELRAHFPCLCAAAESVGSPQIRNRGTLGGSIVNANPSSDIMPVLVAGGASVVLRSAEGTRTIPVDAFVLGPGKTVLEPNEILYEIRLPRCSAGSRMHFVKIGRRSALSIARLNGACIAEVRDGVITSCRICIGAATGQPMRMTQAEQVLLGTRGEAVVAKQAGACIAETILSVTGKRSSSAYKLPVAAELSARLIRETLESEAIL